MKDLVLGFIGAGNMNTAILSGVLRKQMFPPERIWLSNRHAEKLSAFSKLGICTTTDNRAVARNADILILGVKPQMFGDVLPELKDLVSEKCVISIAAGISASYLKAELPGAHIIRAMPNTPLMLGVGATAVARAEDVAPELFQTVLELFRAAGVVAVIEESQMDDIINVNGSAPAWYRRLTAATLEGAARMLAESGKTPEELCRQVCSPGGTTLASLSAFEERDFDGLMLDAMDRCTKRSKELGK